MPNETSRDRPVSISSTATCETSDLSFLPLAPGNRLSEREKFETHHVSSVASGSEDDSHLGVGVEVVGRDEGTGGVVDEGRESDGNVVLFESGAEELSAVDALDSGVAETLGPTDEDTVVDLVLPGGSESSRESCWGREERTARERGGRKRRGRGSGCWSVAETQ
jgi:hypothetical protein